MIHVRVDDTLKADAAEKLAKFGLTVSDAVRILTDARGQGRRLAGRLDDRPGSL